MPHKYPPEFKRDVVAVARRGQAPKEQIASDFGISTSTLKRWMVQADIDDGVTDAEFGYRVIADELHAAGHPASENRVARLCALQRIVSVTVRRRRGSGKRPGPAMHDDLVERDFVAHGLDEIWLTDITEHTTAKGKLYICAVKDVCSRRIVGYALSDRMTSHLADAALRTAIARRAPSGTTVVHSDRGGQFRSRRYQHTLRDHGLVGSMGRVGAAGDNAPMESFFSLLQKNVLDRHSWDTREDLTVAIITWIERTYHRRRRQRALGKLTPIEFETIIDQKELATAA